MENKKTIMIVEDTLAEQEFALKCAQERGLVATLKSDFSSALNGLEDNPDFVLSDLFFPVGNVNSANYVRRILPLYENYLNRFEKYMSGVLVETIVHLAKMTGFTKEQFFEDFISAINKPSPELEMYRDATYGIKNFKKYQNLQKIIENIKQGENIPYGFFLAEELKNKNIPSAIITSINHHDVAFEPLRDSLVIPYFDSLIDGKKDWNRALDYVLKGGEEKWAHNIKI